MHVGFGDEREKRRKQVLEAAYIFAPDDKDGIEGVSSLLI